MPLSSGSTGASAAGAGVSRSQLAEVVRAIRQCPIIDNHAHPLLKPEQLAKYPLLSITTEASGDAMYATSTSLAHIRGIKQLAHVLDCGHTWEAVVAAIEQRRIDDYEDWISECLDGIQTILVDDGLDADEEVYDYDWHASFTRTPCKRIVRIETLAGRIAHTHGLGFKAGDDTDALFQAFLAEFEKSILDAVADPEVVGFKSVVCYRTGLDVPAMPDLELARASFRELVSGYSGAKSGVARIQHPGLNDLIVHKAAQLISQMPGRTKKPIQFHTGLGDNDITLTKSSPSHLQGFIRAYPSLPIVLLHASYPFTRELGYLATMYSNVYADIGEIFPFISKDGQEKALRQILELCPWSKILWSTDGHWFPETYILAIIQVREVLESVLCEFIRKGLIHWKAAIELARMVLFTNSNKIYHLDLEFVEWHENSDANNQDADESIRDETDLDIFTRFLYDNQHGKTPDLVRISWIDMVAFPRTRMIPFRKLITSLEQGLRTDIGLAKATLGQLKNDLLAPGVGPVDEYRLYPDFSSLKAGPVPGHWSMYADFRDQDGSTVPLCPRTQLQRAQELGAQHGLFFLVGFEIEFVLLERSSSGLTALTNNGHAWSTSRVFANATIAKLLADMVRTLESMDIFVEQVHAEGALGQFELVLPPLAPVAAVDTLLHTREVIAALATTAGYRFTLHPKPFAGMNGTAAHAHLSISSSSSSFSSGDVSKDIYEPFYAGILKHLRAIAAFTYSNPCSYERVLDGAWAGGRWVTWGTQNREAPLRKIADSHWEFKCLDGLANAYLAMASILFAGMRGLIDKEPLTWGDCGVDPATLTENDRKELHVLQMLPASVGEALQALKEDEGLIDMLGEELVDRYVAVKEREVQFLESLGDSDQRRAWLMERH
ncbi:hypothetical protein BD289DRAFT_369915 [Coniella lustricola]|uniref:Glutamine synthetase n=1 Tax=Coniella lustricola TaxID=2025994 RepID=A0A2T3A5Z4_9PEZI|nr:hypothetical protein BD289DRAFT_369915 [Coniella lustricola]